MEQDIRESKEYRLAKEWEMAVNSYAFNPARFAAAIPDMHRRYDDRNRASHEEAKRIMEYLRANGRHIPLK